jgi:hypothetical protein
LPSSGMLKIKRLGSQRGQSIEKKWNDWNIKSNYYIVFQWHRCFVFLCWFRKTFYSQIYYQIIFLTCNDSNLHSNLQPVQSVPITTEVVSSRCTRYNIMW